MAAALAAANTCSGLPPALVAAAAAASAAHCILLIVRGLEPELLPLLPEEPALPEEPLLPEEPPPQLLAGAVPFAHPRAAVAAAVAAAFAAAPVEPIDAEPAATSAALGLHCVNPFVVVEPLEQASCVTGPLTPPFISR